jgi:hypothetical protein
MCSHARWNGKFHFQRNTFLGSICGRKHAFDNSRICSSLGGHGLARSKHVSLSLGYQTAKYRELLEVNWFSSGNPGSHADSRQDQWRVVVVKFCVDFYRVVGFVELRNQCLLHMACKPSDKTASLAVNLTNNRLGRDFRISISRRRSHSTY